MAVQLGGGGTGELRDVVQPDAGVGVDDDLDGVATARRAHVELVELEPGAGDDRLQHAVQLPRQWPW